MSRDLIRLMQSLFPAAEVSCEGAWQPAMDVCLTPRGWLLKFELAGVRPEDIDLTVLGNRLTLRGVRRDTFCEERCQFYRMEISYNHFERAVELPVRDLKQAAITTEYRHGMLFVHIPTDTPTETEK